LLKEEIDKAVVDNDIGDVSYKRILDSKTGFKELFTQ